MKDNIIDYSNNYFTLFNKTEDMKIFSKDNKSISLKEILNATKDTNNIGLLKLQNNNIDLFINLIDPIQISFSVFGIEGENILRNPIIFKLPNKEEVEIVSNEQLKFILEKNFENPKLYCSCERITNVSILDLHEHITHAFVINEFEEIKPLEEFEFNMKINQQKNKTFLTKVFKSPTEFEKNFYSYFKIKEKGKKIEGFFKIFDDAQRTRNYILYDFINPTFGQTKKYFGASGKGKSITLIGALKYSILHNKIGTLYINCKAIKSLIEEKRFTEVKNILADEITYLFYGKYNKYLSCFNIIKKFDFFLYNDFWPLIDSILKECFELDKKYIIGFDQYNDLIDPKNYLASLEKKYLHLQEKKMFKFIVISSMNETDVRRQKLNLLFGDNKAQNIRELNSVCDNFETNFNDEQFEAFKKLGKTFKAYNEIQMILDDSELRSYIDEKKKKYLFKMISFYKKDKIKYNPDLSEEEILNISESEYLKFLSFKINYNYNKNEIMEIIDFIPFKLFDISEKRGNYIIKPAFPLINEIIDEIFKYIILSKNFNIFKSLLNSRGSAYSTLFEYKIIYNFNPKIKGEIKYFTNFTITDSECMEVIIPKENDKIKPKFIKKLQKGVTYLIEQKQYGGKALDFLIIHMSDNPKVFGFQVSTYKPEIFTSLSNVYKTLIEQLNLCFDIKINKDNLFFGYIFDYSRKRDQEYRPMISKCVENKMKYSYYDVDSNKLYDKIFHEAHDIYIIADKPLLKIEDNKINYLKNLSIKNYNPMNQFF